MVMGLLTGKMPKVPKQSIGFVDVRDVALAHLKGIQLAAAKNQRFIMSERDLWYREFAAILKEEFGPQGYNVTTDEAPGDNNH